MYASKVVRLALALSLVLLVTLPIAEGCVTPEPPQDKPKEKKEHPKDRKTTTCLVVIYIMGLPKSYETTVYIDGKQWGTYSGGECFSLHVRAKTQHKISVQLAVEGTKGEFQANENVLEINNGGSYTFRYALVET